MFLFFVFLMTIMMFFELEISVKKYDFKFDVFKLIVCGMCLLQSVSVYTNNKMIVL